MTATLSSEQFAIPQHLPQRWLLLLAQLDPRQREFTPADLAPLLNISRVTVRETMQELWPTRCGHYRLSYHEAALVLAMRDSGARKATPHADLYIELRQLRRITAQFPDDVPYLVRARDWVWVEQERRTQEWAGREERDKALRAARLRPR